MTTHKSGQSAGQDFARRLFVYNTGFLTQARVKRILDLAGWQVSLGKPAADDWVGVWGKSPTSPRGEAVAGHTNAQILRVEDAFLRSVLPGRSGQPPVGLCIDRSGVHFDSTQPSDLEHMLATHPLDDTALLDRARTAAARVKQAQISKYNAFDLDAPLPQAPYVLVIDQTREDASLIGTHEGVFQEMLVFAQTEHPGSRIIIKTHPETAAGHRPGHFGSKDETDRVQLCTAPVSPWQLLENATAVYTVSSQLGFEAIYAGHKPRVFGQPFYAGWGLTQDENPVPRRERRLTRAQLFAAAMILYPTWYDPYRDQLCELEDVLDTLTALARTWREDRAGYDAIGFRRWKHGFVQSFFGSYSRVTFRTRAQTGDASRPTLVWGPKSGGAKTIHVEDGFLRSRGLGANLVAPMSLVADPVGIYYDPNRPSRLEALITASVDLPDAAIDRARRLRNRLRQSALSKYNLTAQKPEDLPIGHRILVVGQVEDDQSILLGCGDVKTNLDLLQQTRARNPDAKIIFKPHPDVEAGRRKGALSPEILLQYADAIASDTDPISIINQVDEVWTMTSLLGFEALIRDTAVTCLGTPFYAGWGLTQDLAEAPQRRQAQPTLAQFLHACLIDYPRYHDPVTGTPCPVEVVLDRLETGEIPGPSWIARLATQLQRLLGPS